MKKKKRKPKTIDTLFSNVIQGLMFWVGYKKILYPYYHFSEGAITTELYTLFNSLQDGKMRVCPEFLYKNIPSVKNKKESSKKTDSQERVDILIIDPKKSRNFEKNNSKDIEIIETDKLYLFEVKRMESTGDISKDIEKLDECKQRNENVRAFLILINQTTLPKISKKNNFELDEFIKNWEKRIQNFVIEKSKKYKTRIIMNKVATSAKRGATSNSSFGVLVEILKKEK